MPNKARREITRWLIVIIAILLIRVLLIEAYIIPTPSMESTLLIGDAVLVNHLAGGVNLPFTRITLIPGRIPDRGELVVFRYPYENRDYVKRCVALAGDTVEITDKILFVNARPVPEPYVRHDDSLVYPGTYTDPGHFQTEWEQGKLAALSDTRDIRDNFGPVVVPKDNVFVMGDNRDNSFDSRFWGPLHRNCLRGRPVFIYFSFDPGVEPTSALDILSFWKWKKIRWNRIFHVPF